MCFRRDVRSTSSDVAVEAVGNSDGGGPAHEPQRAAPRQLRAASAPTGPPLRPLDVPARGVSMDSPPPDVKRNRAATPVNVAGRGRRDHRSMIAASAIGSQLPRQREKILGTSRSTLFMYVRSCDPRCYTQVLKLDSRRSR